MKVQNQKTSNYKDEIQKENFTGGKLEMTYITGGKTLLTLIITPLFIIFFTCFGSLTNALSALFNILLICHTPFFDLRHH